MLRKLHPRKHPRIGIGRSWTPGTLSGVCSKEESNRTTLQQLGLPRFLRDPPPPRLHVATNYKLSLGPEASWRTVKTRLKMVPHFFLRRHTPVYQLAQLLAHCYLPSRSMISFIFADNIKHAARWNVWRLLQKSLNAAWAFSVRWDSEPNSNHYAHLHKWVTSFIFPQLMKTHPSPQFCEWMISCDRQHPEYSSWLEEISRRYRTVQNIRIYLLLTGSSTSRIPFCHLQCQAEADHSKLIAFI